MARGISLHIGLNNVDLSQYPGYEIPVLRGCINDANSMSDIAKATGFATSDMLLNDQATAMNVKDKIASAAAQLVNGDIFLMTYSGHGSQIPDEKGEDDNGYSETWVLYDRQLIDDELYALWPSFKENVRIFVLSDSCHSGTMVKMLISDYVQGKGLYKKGIRSKNFDSGDIDQLLALTSQKKAVALITGYQSKSIPLGASLNNYLLKKELYQNIQHLTKDLKEITASLIYISGCQDNQTSGDGPKNGVFTGNLLNVWDSGSFAGDYKGFHKRILALMPADQTPNYMTLGINISPFEIQKPFTVLPADNSNSAGNGTSSATAEKPSITGPSSWNSNSLPPSFNVNKGSNPYYYVEVATDPGLFNNAMHGNERSDNNFFATWNDAANGNKLFEEAQYQLPQQIWGLLKSSDKIYYRLGTTIDEKWNGWMVTIDDDHYQDAPYINIVQEAVPSNDSTSSDKQDNTIGENKAQAERIVVVEMEL